MGKGNPFIALRLPRDEEQRLRAKASESGASLSEFVRQALAHYTTGVRQPPRARVKRPRASSRPVRLQRVTDEVEELLADYETWQSNLPEALQDTATAELLSETIEALQQALDTLTTISPPRGFGRD